MGSIIPFDENMSLQEKIKTLPDEELLEIWAESQRMESIIHSQLPENVIISPDFEDAIVSELSLRTTRKLAGI